MFLISLSLVNLITVFASVCPIQVINPSCSQGMQKPDDLQFPCMAVDTYCSNITLLSEEVGCLNWICSLRINCGCFAGEDTSCIMENSNCSKAGCADIVSMFNEIGCNYSTFLGSRPNVTYFTGYINQCLAGCDNATLGVTLSAFLLLISNIGFIYLGFFWLQLY